jgi:flagellar biosynthesis component FlhA
MVRTASTEREQTDRSVAEMLWHWRAELLWGFAVTVLLFACVNPMIVLGLLLAAATFIAACWAYRNIADGAEREEEKLASASTTQLRPAPSQLGPGKSPVHTPWHRHHAA